MGQFSIAKAVGKNCFGASSADVMTVQLALKDKNQRTKFGFKSYYQGKIDGKAKAKTIDAILCFQADNKIPADGKVQPMGRTINTLARSLSSACLKDIAASQLGEKRVGAPTALQRKAEQAGGKSAQIIRTKFPLPKAEAESLAKLIQAIARRGIVLGIGETDITNDGRFKVILTTDTSALPHNVPAKIATDRALSTLKDEAARSLGWSMHQPEKLSVVSRTAYDELKGLKAPGPGYLKSLGLQGVTIEPAQKRLLAAAEVLEIRKAQQ